MTPGLHGFHIHEFADFSNGCVSAGPHYNPHGNPHGGPEDEIRHVGDLGNINADADGVAAGSIVAPLVHLSGEFSVIGRSIMIHADPDDLGKVRCIYSYFIYIIILIFFVGRSRALIDYW